MFGKLNNWSKRHNGMSAFWRANELRGKLVRESAFREPIDAPAAIHVDRGAYFYAMTSFTTSPWTSVRRKSRPA